MMSPLFNAVLAFSALISGLWCGAASAAGDLILIGGGTRTPELIERIGKAAGGSNAKIVIAPWATKEPQASLEILNSQFSSFKPKSIDSAPFFPEEYDPATGTKCKEVLTFHQPIELFSRAEKDKFLASLSSATALYLTGGNQNRILKVVTEDAEIRAAIQSFRLRGGLYVGTSAGTAAVPQLMMNGELLKLADGTDMAVVANGLGFLPPGVFVDQHFIQRGRFDRLKNLVIPDRTHIGIGISESTAAIIKDNGILEVIGESEVVFYFYERSDLTGPLQELRLGRGKRFDLNTRRVIP